MLPQPSDSPTKAENKSLQRVRNPFEVALTERLQKPTIDSPNLFQIPPTPQLSSTQFEWTIDEVSSLQPANVELNETQFQHTPNPDLEEKAQSIIASFFKEQQIVPSPVNCPLRNKRIILSELNSHTPIAKPVKRIRDMGTQTDLSLPAELPKQLMDLLLQFAQKHASADECVVTAKRHTIDVSLRRKLFDMHNIMVLDNDGNTSAQWLENNGSNATAAAMQCTAIVGKLSDTDEKSSFGSLSPISVMEALSDSSRSLNLSSHQDNEKDTKSKKRLHKFIDDLENIEELSPIRAERTGCRKSICLEQGHIDTDQMEISAALALDDVNANSFTPNRSSSPMRCIDMSTSSSISIKMSELHHGTDSKQPLQIIEEDMQMSSHRQHVNTPLRRHLTQSRKNLSQSFNIDFINGADNSDEEQQQQPTVTAYEELQNAKIKMFAELPQQQQVQVQQENTVNINIMTETEAKQLHQHEKAFYRVDSGFNDMSSSCSNGNAPTCDDNSSESMQF